MQDLAERKLVELQKADRDSADAVRWLRENQHRFKMQVMEPPMLALSVPDHRYSDAIESCLSWNQMRVRNRVLPFPSWWSNMS